MMRQYFLNLAAETGASEMSLVGDKARLPCFSFSNDSQRRTSCLSISVHSCSKTSTSSSKFEISEDDFAPSFPTRKLSSGSLTSSSDYDDDDDSQLSNSRWVSTPTTRSKSFSPVSLTRRSHHHHHSTRKGSSDNHLSSVIKTVILRDFMAHAPSEAKDESPLANIPLTPPKRKDSIEDALFCLTGLRRTRSADLVAPVVKCHSRWSAMAM